MFVVVSVLGRCFVMQYFVSFSSFTIILLGKSEPVALYFFLFSRCHVAVIVCLPLPR